MPSSPYSSSSGLPLVPARAAAIVDAAFVAEALKRGAIVWDVRDAAAYQRGHIAGAVNVGDALRVLRNPTTEDFIETARIEAILGGGGIDPAREIVVYSTRGHVGAYFAHFAIRYFGGQNVSVYHDGIDGWTDDKRPLETSETRLAPVTLNLAPNSAVAVSTAEMLARLQDKNVQIVDVRTRDEFAGLDVRAIRGGHVPGAVNIPYEENWVDPDTAGKLARREVANNRGMSLKSDADLRSLYSRLDANKETIVYCQSGVRSAETAAVLGKLGFRNVKVYDFILARLRRQARCAGGERGVLQCRRAARAAHCHAGEDRCPGKSARRDARAGAEVEPATTLDRAGTGLRRT